MIIMILVLESEIGKMIDALHIIHLLNTGECSVMTFLKFVMVNWNLMKAIIH